MVVTGFPGSFLNPGLLFDRQYFDKLNMTIKLLFYFIE